MKQIIVIFLFCLILVSCKETKNTESITGVAIDATVSAVVEKHIESVKELDEVKDKIQMYNNSISSESYQNDTLAFTTNEATKKVIFKSFYYWFGDTLCIDGAYGMFGGTGFCIKIIKGKAQLYHLLASDDFPTYAYNEKDSLIYRLEVPCTDTKIILSELPDSTQKQIVFGYVEFKSKDFYSSSGSTDGKEDLPRIKSRNNMKIYFKSGYMSF
ncbi:MAG: hypothetical protein KAZ71_04710 [Bacteroidia bacterium]|nr:hypothetical protein [Bacteroidia bacterium]